MSKIRVALAGVGNCASAFVQGANHYAEAEKEEQALGLRRLFLGGYHPRDVEFVCAFDIEARKVGKDLSSAIFSKPNNTLRFANVPKLEVPVLKGPALDGVGPLVKKIVKESTQPEADVAKELKHSKAEILVDLLPSGAVKATEWYAGQALKADCAFVNATPVFIASSKDWAERFEKADLPLVGDDLADQVGSTAVHKTLLKLLSEQGVRINETYQLDVGGGTESLDTLDRTRELKRTVKTQSVESVLPYKASVVAGSTDYVDFLENRRDSFFWIKGSYFGKVPMLLDLRLSTVDAPNAGSVLFDVVRAVKLALDRRIGGVLTSVSAYAFKHPLEPSTLEVSEQWLNEFILGKRER
ncbi:MAG TPA: inositol-3-phosphate synthase [Candidatus Bathyarchaeia archaeon]|nr:inositol-3-phosphate synthase [Candidatus Bathyarchaeia archaeon]